MKKLLLTACAALMLAACAQEDKSADPHLRDRALLEAGLSYYGEDPDDDTFDDMYYAFAADDNEMEDAADDARRAFKAKVKKLPEKSRSYLKSVFNDLADLAVLANYSYKDSKVDLPKGWTDLGEQDPKIAGILKNTSASSFLASGLKCSLVAKGDRKVLVFAGTDFPSDWSSFDQITDFFVDAYEDVYGALNSDASQVKRAEKVVKELLDAGYVDLGNLEFAGHSLGGRLASEMAVKYGCPAVVFNAAGVSPDVYQIYEDARDSADELWRGYILDVVSANDPLTVSQKYMSGKNDPIATKVAKVLSTDNNTVDEVVSLGLDLLGVVVDKVTGSTQVTDAVRGLTNEYGEVVERLHERDYRAIGAVLPLRENLEGHGIGSMVETLRERARTCE